MSNTCTNCGNKLEKDYKYCPKCGIEIKSHPTESVQDTNISSVAESENLSVIICSLCGDENNPESKICSGCGAPLEGEKIEKTIKQPVAKVSSEDKQKIQKTKSGREKTEVSKPGSGADLPVNDDSGKSLEPSRVMVVLAGVIILTLIVLAASGVFSGKSVPPPQQVQDQQGVDLSNIDHINELEQKVKENPDDLETLLHLAHLKNDSGMFEQAIQSYKTYLEKKPADADARIDMGVCYFNLGNYEIAEQEMLKALEYKPDHQIGHLNLGIVNLRAGKLAESKEWFKKAVVLNPESEIGKRAAELLSSH